MTVLDSNFTDPSSVSPRPTGIRYGIIAGLVNLIISIIFIVLGMLDITGLKSQFFSSLFIYLLYITVLVFAVLNYRNKILGGKISFGKAFNLGFWISTICAIISAIGLYFYTQYIDADYLNNSLNNLTEYLREKGINEEKIELSLSKSKFFMTPIGFSISVFFDRFISGLLFSLIIGLIVKRE